MCSQIDSRGFVNCQSKVEWELLDSLLIRQLAGTFRRMSSLNLGHAGLLPRSPYPRHPKYSMAYLLMLPYHYRKRPAVAKGGVLDSICGNGPTRRHCFSNLEYLHAFWSVCQILVNLGIFRKRCTQRCCRRTWPWLQQWVYKKLFEILRRIKQRCMHNFFFYDSNYLLFIPIYIQQDATLHILFIYGNCSTRSGWYLHP